MNELAASLVTIVLISMVAALIFVVAGTFILDLKLARQQKDLKNIPGKRFLKLGIIIYANNDAPVIESSLRALRATRLRSLEIVVIDNASKDGTAAQLRNFLTSHPKFQAKAIYKRKPNAKDEVLKMAMKKMEKSSHVLCINASCLVNKENINELRRLLAASPQTPPTALATLPIVENSYLNLAKSCKEILAYNFKKAALSFGITLKSREDDALLLPIGYSHNKRPALNPGFFAINLYHKPKALFHSVSLWTVPFSVAGIILVPYLLFLAVANQITTPFLFSAAVIYSALLLGYTGVTLTAKGQKALLFSTLPLMYPLIYIYNILQITNSAFSLVKTRLNIRVLN